MKTIKSFKNKLLYETKSDVVNLIKNEEREVFIVEYKYATMKKFERVIFYSYEQAKYAFTIKVLFLLS